MTKLFLFLDGNTWKGNWFPEEPDTRYTPLMDMEYVNKRHYAAVEKAKAEAFEVVNPEAYGFFKYENNWLIDVGCAPITDVRPIKPGVLYPWDGGWEIVEQFLNGDGNHWLDWNGRQMSLYGCKGRRKVLRLLPKSPVTKGASDDYPIVDVLRRGGEADTLSDETPYLDKLEALVNTAVVAAIGVPELEEVNDWREAYQELAEKYVNLQNEVMMLKAAPVNDAGGGKIDDTDEIQHDLHVYGVAYEIRDDNGSIRRLDPTKIRVRKIAQPSPQAESQYPFAEVGNVIDFWCQIDLDFLQEIEDNSPAFYKAMQSMIGKLQPDK
jgi:hypothetical protein